MTAGEHSDFRSRSHEGQFYVRNNRKQKLVRIENKYDYFQEKRTNGQ